MRKNIFISLFSGFVAMLCFAYFANAQGVALPTNVGLPGGDLTGVIANFTNWLLGIFGFLAIISFLVSGMMYFFSAGDDKAQEKAKKQMTWSIMGVVIGLIGLVVINAVDMFLRGGGISNSSSSSSSSIINDAANSPMTGATVPSLPGTTPSSPSSTNYTLVGIDGKADNYMYKDEQNNYYVSESGKFTPGSKNDVVPITMLGTLTRTGNTVMRDTYGNYYEAGGSYPVPLKLQDGDAINYFPSKK